MLNFNTFNFDRNNESLTPILLNKASIKKEVFLQSILIDDNLNFRAYLH